MRFIRRPSALRNDLWEQGIEPPDQRDIELQQVHDVYRLSGTDARARLANAIHRIGIPHFDEADAMRATLLDLERILTGDESIGRDQREEET